MVENDAKMVRSQSSPVRSGDGQLQCNDPLRPCDPTNI